MSTKTTSAPQATRRAGSKTMTIDLRESSTKATRGSTQRRTATPHIPQEKIAERAYQIWLERGCPQGQESENWYAAEQQLLKEAEAG